MGKGEESFLISAGDQRRPPSLLQIFREAVRLLGTSWKPLLSIFLVLLLPYSLLFLGNYLTVYPLIMDMVNKFFAMRTKDQGSPEFRDLLAAATEDLREITAAEVATRLVFHLLSLLLLMATVYTAAMARRGEQVTLGEVFSGMRRTWKGTVATGLYVYLLRSGYTTVLFVLIGVLAFVSHGSMAVLALCAVVAIMAFLLLLYLDVIWNGGLVISVVEEDCSGLAALGRASELIRGRRRLGFRVNLYLMLTATILFVPFSLVNSVLPPSENMQLLGGLLALYHSLLMSVFMLAVYVVFYDECKRSHDEDAAIRESFVYTRVPTAPTIDGALP